MKKELHGEAAELCLRKSGEKYNNKCIFTTVKQEWHAMSLFSCWCGEPLHCEKSFNTLE